MMQASSQRLHSQHWLLQQLMMTTVVVHTSPAAAPAGRQNPLTSGPPAGRAPGSRFSVQPGGGPSQQTWR